MSLPRLRHEAVRPPTVFLYGTLEKPYGNGNHYEVWGPGKNAFVFALTPIRPEVDDALEMSEKIDV